jgi:hypothetical protein
MDIRDKNVLLTKCYYSSILKAEAADFCEIMVHIYETWYVTSQRHNHLDIHTCQYLESLRCYYSY